MEKQKFDHGTINWRDLTTTKADELREFYREIAGWTSEEIAMKDGDEDYSDYVMKDGSGTAVGGICHARGTNAGIPPQWVNYISVDHLETAVEKAKSLGAQVIREQKSKDGSLFYAILEDPSGAVFGLAKTQF